MFSHLKCQYDCSMLRVNEVLCIVLLLLGRDSHYMRDLSQQHVQRTVCHSQKIRTKKTMAGKLPYKAT